MSETTKLKRKLKKFFSKVWVRKGSGTALMWYNITILLPAPPVKIEELWEKSELVSDLFYSVFEEFYDFTLKFVDYDGNKVRVKRK